MSYFTCCARDLHFGSKIKLLLQIKTCSSALPSHSVAVIHHLYTSVPLCKGILSTFITHPLYIMTYMTADTLKKAVSTCALYCYTLEPGRLWSDARTVRHTCVQLGAHTTAWWTSSMPDIHDLHHCSSTLWKLKLISKLYTLRIQNLVVQVPVTMKPLESYSDLIRMSAHSLYSASTLFSSSCLIIPSTNSVSHLNYTQQFYSQYSALDKVKSTT